MARIKEIEEITKEYACARNLLATAVRLLEDEITAAKKRHMVRIKALLARAVERKSILEAAIDEDHGLFARPRTHVFHGVKVGLQKGKGKIILDDEARTLALLHKLYGTEVEEGHFIKVEESIIRKDLEKLPAADLKKLGVTIEDATDEVVIKPVDSEVEKLVDALLKGADDARKEAA